MGLRDLFRREETDPRAIGLQKGDQKVANTSELILPPRDKKGKLVPDRSRMPRKHLNLKQDPIQTVLRDMVRGEMKEGSLFSSGVKQT